MGIRKSEFVWGKKLIIINIKYMLLSETFFKDNISTGILMGIRFFKDNISTGILLGI